MIRRPEVSDLTKPLTRETLNEFLDLAKQALTEIANEKDGYIVLRELMTANSWIGQAMHVAVALREKGRK